MNRVYFSSVNNLWYINCPRCGVTHGFGIGHEFDGNMEYPTLKGSIGWTGVTSKGIQEYCHSIVTNGKIKFDDGYEELLAQF